MKAQTLLSGSNGIKKLNEGDLVIALQCNRVEHGNGEYQLETNIDWSFDDETTPIEIKSFLGAILGSIEEIFGEKMVTEAILHYAEENNHLIKTPQGAGLHFKSKGLDFKNWKK